MFAFTLAETLITLVIIGVIAAMTVPSLMNKTNNQETVSKLKKAYSTLSQATNQIIAEEGPTTSWATSIENIYDLYKKKLHNVKECGSETGCMRQGAYTYLNGRDKSGTWENNPKQMTLITADGTQLMFEGNNNLVDSTCTQSYVGSDNVCFVIAVDINGEKKPNIVARDLFIFAVKKNGLFPAGCDSGTCVTGTGSGYACACKVLREGAINY